MSNAEVLELLKDKQEEQNYMVTATSLIDSLKRIDLLPLDSVQIRFSDDIWAINKMNRHYNKFSNFIIDFESIPYMYKDLLKGLIFKYIVLDNFALETVRGKYYGLRKILKEVYSKKIYDLYTLNIKEINEVIEKKELEKEEVTWNLKDQRRRLLLELIIFQAANDIKEDYTSIITYLSNNTFTKKLKVEKRQNRTPNIPKDIFDALIKQALEEIDDISLLQEFMIQAAIILLFSQTGLRVHEVAGIKKRSLFSIEVIEGKEPFYYMTYTSTKAKKKNAETFMTDRAVRAYRYLEMVANEKSEYLISTELGEPQHKEFYRKNIRQFIFRNATAVKCLNRRLEDVAELESIKLDKDTHKLARFSGWTKWGGNIQIGDTITLVKPHQFRVAICTELIKKGFSLQWVRKHMNHLEGEVTMGYIRLQEEDKKEKMASQEIVKNIIKGEVRLIGNNSEILMQRIDNFIKENKYNIEKDLETVTTKLLKKIPIRIKHSGYCIKSHYGRKCTHDGLKDPIYCIFGVCPNHFVTYKIVNITYKEVQEFQTIIEYNLSHGFIVQAQLELRKLKRVLTKAFIPQLQEIKLEIEKHSEESLINKNEDLVFFITNVDELMKEAEEWQRKEIALPTTK